MVVPFRGRENRGTFFLAFLNISGYNFSAQDAYQGLYDCLARQEQDLVFAGGVLFYDKNI